MALLDPLYQLAELVTKAILPPETENLLFEHSTVVTDIAAQTLNWSGRWNHMFHRASRDKVVVLLKLFPLHRQLEGLSRRITIRQSF